MKEKNDQAIMLLLHELSEVREYERSLFAQFGVIISIVALLLAAIPEVFERFPNMPVWAYVLTPFVPSALLAYAVLISMWQILRSHYARIVERRIQKLTNQQDDPLPIPCWDHLHMEITGQKHAQWYAQANWASMYVVIVVMLSATLYFAVSKIPDKRLLVLALALNAIALGLPAIALGRFMSRGPESWDDAVATLHESLKRTDRKFQRRRRAERNERSLFTYLLLPRNEEELLKWLFLPICFAIGAWFFKRVVPWRSQSFAHFAGFFIVFEILIYQARYLLNDLRDRRVDGASTLSKPRFPSSWVFSHDGRVLDFSKQPREKARADFALAAACVSFIGRWILAALVVGCLFPIENVTHNRWIWDAMFITGIFVLGLPYEFARSKCSFVCPDDQGSARLRYWTAITVFLVGLGYGLRSGAGMWLAGGRGLNLLFIFIAASLFGSSFVALCWAIESTRASTQDLCNGKGHLVGFRNSLKRLTEFAMHEPVPDKPPLRGWQRITAYWSFYPVLATCALAIFVIHALGIHVKGAVYAVPILALGAVLAAITPLRVTAPIVLIGFWCFMVSLRHYSVPTVDALISSGIVLLPLGVMCIFRNLCYNELPGVMTKIGRFLAIGPRAFYEWFKSVREDSRAKGPSVRAGGCDKIVRSEAASGGSSR